MPRLFLIFFNLLFLNLVSRASPSDSLYFPALKVELALFDLPYQQDAARTVSGNTGFGGYFKGYANPSMQQSLSLTTSLYSSIHYGLDRGFDIHNRGRETKIRVLHSLSLIATDLLMTWAPGGEGWLHEEYHRSVMTRHRVNSFNGMNVFPVGSETVSVNHVTDADLIRFKSEAPWAFIRMHVAGIEGSYQLIDNLQKHNFFYNRYTSHQLLYMFSTLNSIFYVRYSSDPDQVDVITENIMSRENSVEDRDFTGFDFAGWVYDIFKPMEPYSGRGPHPSGIGIDRYITTTEMTRQERDYLEKQGLLHFLNLGSPMLFYKKPLVFNKGIHYNFAFRHLLTPFGNDIAVKFLLQSERHNYIMTYHHANNYDSFFPALEAELYEFPILAGPLNLALSPGLLAGVQPRGNSFMGSDKKLVGRANLKSELILSGWLNPWFEVSYKTGGWIAGNEFLESNLGTRMGISGRFK